MSQDDADHEMGAGDNPEGPSGELEVHSDPDVGTTAAYPVVRSGADLEESEPPIIGDRRTTFLLAIAAVLLVLAALVSVPHFVGGSSKSSAQPQLATAATRTFPVVLTASGTVVPASEIAENFDTSGRVSEIDVTPGQKVTAGTVLAKVDNPGPAADLAKAQAAVSNAQAALSAAKQPLDPGRAAQLQQAITSAQAQLTQTNNQAAATAQQDAASLSADQTQLSSDQSRLTQDGCSVSQPSNALVCQDIQTAITADEGRISVDTARQQSDASSSQLRISQAQGQLTLANAAYQAAATPVPATVASAQAALDAANAQLAAAQGAMVGLSIVAPTDATVLQVNGQVGESVVASATSQATLPGTTAPIPEIAGLGVTSSSATPTAGSQPFIVLGNTGTFVVGAAFPSGQVGQLSANQSGTLTASSVAGLSVPCHVLAIAPNSTNINGQPYTYVSIAPEGSTAALSSGMSVSVNITVAQAKSVLAVPLSAIYNLSGTPHVDVWDGTRPVSTAVTTGLQGSTLVQITSGLTVGEQVVLSAYQGLPSTTTP